VRLYELTERAIRLTLVSHTGSVSGYEQPGSQ